MAVIRMAVIMMSMRGIVTVDRPRMRFGSRGDGMFVTGFVCARLFVMRVSAFGCMVNRAFRLVRDMVNRLRLMLGVRLRFRMRLRMRHRLRAMLYRRQRMALPVIPANASAFESHTLSIRPCSNIGTCYPLPTHPIPYQEHGERTDSMTRRQPPKGTVPHSALTGRYNSIHLP
jgi:hypothetical protein